MTGAGRWSTCALIVAALWSCTGCMTLRGSLASSTGPSPDAWSTADEQMVHVGEHVRFSFVMTQSLHAEQGIDPVGLVDYCLMRVNNKLIEPEMSTGGQYILSHLFDDIVDGQQIRVAAMTYRIHGQRDRRLIAGEWVNLDTPDRADQLVARDEILLTAYKSRIELPVTPIGEGWDILGGRLRLIRSDGGTVVIRAAIGHDDGFVVRGPFEEGEYMITYAPDAEMLNPKGTTRIQFVVTDDRGKQHVIERLLSTP